MRFLIFAAFLFASASPRHLETPHVGTNCSLYLPNNTEHCIFAVRGGDLIKPSFSPNGRYLAFATVTRRSSSDAETDEFSELDGTLVADFQTRTVKVLLTPEQSRKYASYSAFVGGIKWLDNQTLRVTYADGDVDWDDLTFRLSDSKLLASTHGSVDEEASAQPEKPDSTILTIKEIRKRLPYLPSELSLESGRLSPDQTMLALVVGNEPQRLLLIFRLHPRKKS